MRLAPKAKAAPPKSEQIILFRIGGALFAVSSSSVQEVRSVDSLAGAAAEIKSSTIKKVRHTVRRGDQILFVVNGTIHFGLPLTPGTLLFILRQTRTALLIDGIERMTSMSQLQALPAAFHGAERQWYRGLTALDQTVIPVVNPEGFLTEHEVVQLQRSISETELADAAREQGGAPL